MPFKRSMLWRDIVKSLAEIICLQENHLLLTDLHRLKHKKFSHAFQAAAIGKKGYFVKESVASQIMSTVIDSKGRFVILNCVLNSRTCTILSLYAPNHQQISFINKTVFKGSLGGEGLLFAEIIK